MEGFLPLYATADSMPDDPQPTTKRFFVSNAGQSAISRQHRFNENIFGVFSVTASTEDLPIDSILVFTYQPVIVQELSPAK